MAVLAAMMVPMSWAMGAESEAFQWPDGEILIGTLDNGSEPCYGIPWPFKMQYVSGVFPGAGKGLNNFRQFNDCSRITTTRSYYLRPISNIVRRGTPEQAADWPHPKSILLAVLLSAVIPPLPMGHVYLGQYGHAAAYTAAFWAPLGIYALFPQEDKTIGLALIAAGFSTGAWVASVIHSGISANRINWSLGFETQFFSGAPGIAIAWKF